MQLRTSARSALKTKQLGATVAAVPAAVRLTSSHAAAAQLSGAAAAAPRQMGVMHRNVVTRFRENDDPTAPTTPMNPLRPGASPMVGHAVPVLFRLSQRCAFGQAWGVVGGAEELGGWDTGRAVALKWTAGDEWFAIVHLPEGTTAEYKFVLLDAKRGNKFMGWANQVAGPGNLKLDVRVGSKTQSNNASAVVAADTFAPEMSRYFAAVAPPLPTPSTTFGTPTASATAGTTPTDGSTTTGSTTTGSTTAHTGTTSTLGRIKEALGGLGTKATAPFRPHTDGPASHDMVSPAPGAHVPPPSVMAPGASFYTPATTPGTYDANPTDTSPTPTAGLVPPSAAEPGAGMGGELHTTSMTTSYTAAPTAAGYMGAAAGNLPGGMPASGIDYNGQVVPPVHAEVPSTTSVTQPLGPLRTHAPNTTTTAPMHGADLDQPAADAGVELPVSPEAATTATIMSNIGGGDEEIPMAPLSAGTTPITGASAASGAGLNPKSNPVVMATHIFFSKAAEFMVGRASVPPVAAVPETSSNAGAMDPSFSAGQSDIPFNNPNLGGAFPHPGVEGVKGAESATTPTPTSAFSGTGATRGDDPSEAPESGTVRDDVLPPTEMSASQAGAADVHTRAEPASDAEYADAPESGTRRY